MSTLQPAPTSDPGTSQVHNSNADLEQTNGQRSQPENFRCGAFTRSDLLKRHEAGHNRWDHETTRSKRRSTKRKKAREQWTDENVSNSPKIIYDPGCETSDAGLFYTAMASYHSDLAKETHHGILADVGIQQPHGILAQSQETVPGMQMNPDDFLDYQCDSVDFSFAPFDFSSFLMPQNITPLGHEWSSFDFYAAMRETEDEWGKLGHLDPSPASADTWSSAGQSSRQHAEKSRNTTNQSPNHDGLISRMYSPPNEASEEDKWPFQWDPKSQQILTAHPMMIADNHPLFHCHDPRFDIAEATVLKLKSFLQPQFPDYLSTKRSFVLPPLKLINLFIGLFFEHFSPQMPVFHHATINSNTDLPPPLIAAMIAIGAIYIHLKHTRRFAIVLLDATR
ncbi:hypothetical protein BKA65DRAFT_485828 [Rhexocercosporidium sp. MPI-PUGE-AT-0058]|nr:hypothetical protein BKA65DRAFT_485828 [Rhexocercosporidium sp. MPI-PUGE-AT-0058]